MDRSLYLVATIRPAELDRRTMGRRRPAPVEHPALAEPPAPPWPGAVDRPAGVASDRPPARVTDDRPH